MNRFIIDCVVGVIAIICIALLIHFDARYAYALLAGMCISAAMLLFSAGLFVFSKQERTTTAGAYAFKVSSGIMDFVMIAVIVYTCFIGIRAALP
ncbi:MAG: hypothetical protein ISN29_02400 [Gammaproteobacteria bacterium AqS3]|nr:hypothetical protein [Gammaproteobacteria bacterium AqS3]